MQKELKTIIKSGFANSIAFSDEPQNIQHVVSNSAQIVGLMNKHHLI
jgi:hypothetical protein